jgi:hypothetical protein
MHEYDRIYDAYKQLITTGDMSREDKKYFGEGFNDLSEIDGQKELKRIPSRFLGVWDTVTTLFGNVEEVVPPDGRSWTERLKDGIKELPSTTQNLFTNTSDSNEDKIGHQAISELPGIVTKACRRWPYMRSEPHILFGSGSLAPILTLEGDMRIMIFQI